MYLSICLGFKEAGKLEEEAGRGSAAAALYIELGIYPFNIQPEIHQVVVFAINE